MASRHCGGGFGQAATHKIIVAYEEPPRIRDKWCYACRAWYPGTTEYFFSNAKRGDGLSDECKTCNTRRRKNRKIDAKLKLREIKEAVGDKVV